MWNLCSVMSSIDFEYVNKDNIDLIMEDWNLLYNITHPGIKSIAQDLFIAKWREANETAFVDYFAAAVAFWQARSTASKRESLF